MTRKRSGSASVAGAFGMLAICGILVLGLVSGCTPSDGATRPPKSPDASSVVPKSPSPSPSPSPDPEEAAVAGAKATYMAYAKAVDEMYRNGGGNELSDELKRTLTGQAADVILTESKDTKESGRHQVGRTRISELQVNVVNLNADPQTVTFRVCTDRTATKIFEGKKVIKGLPTYIAEQPEIHYLKGRWLIASVPSQTAESC